MMNWKRLTTQTLRAARQFSAKQNLSCAPWWGTFRRYNRADWRADSRAALSVCLMAIPQGIAHAAMAGLPIPYGIIGSAAAMIIAPFVAGSRHTILGTTNATALMVYSFFAASPLLHVQEQRLIPLLGLMVGLFCLIGALLRTAELLQYISRSVLVGYITGAAVLIMASQLKHALGIQLPGSDPPSFIALLWALGKQAHTANWDSALPLAIGTLTLYLWMQRRWPKSPNFAIVFVLSSTLWTVLASLKVGHFAAMPCYTSFTLQDLTPQLPDLWRASVFDDISSLLGLALALAFFASLENTAMAKTLASRTGENPRVNQDMLAVGLGNAVAALAGGMPASGSLIRSTLNHSAGAATRFSSLWAGILTLIIAIALGTAATHGFSPLAHVPKASLAALIIGLALSLIQRKQLRVCLRSTSDDAAVLIATIAATLLAPLHTAIFLGVGFSILLFLRRASQPQLVEYHATETGELSELRARQTRTNASVSFVHVEGDLFFGAAELFRSQIQRLMADPSLKIIILRLKNARLLDATAVFALSELLAVARGQQRHLLIVGCTRPVFRVLKRSGLLDELQANCDRNQGETNVIPEVPSNPNLATRAVMKRAQELLGDVKADVHIFVGDQKKSQT